MSCCVRKIRGPGGLRRRRPASDATRASEPLPEPLAFEVVQPMPVDPAVQHGDRCACAECFASANPFLAPK